MRALIVGGRGGLGSALAEIYSARGREVQRISRTGKEPGDWVCDLADPAQVSALAGDAARMSGFDLCLFAAGTSEAGYLDDLPDEAFRRCLEVNLLAPLALFRALAMASQPCRRFVFVLSGAAELLVPGLAPYALSKRALRDVLAIRELEGSFPDCRILSVWPGPQDPPFAAPPRLHGPYRLPKRSGARPPAEVALRIVEAEEAGRKHLVLSPLPNLLGRLQACLPAAVGVLVRSRFRRAPGSPGPRASPGS